MNLRKRTSEKIVYLDQDSDIEQDFKELKVRKSITKESDCETKLLKLNDKSKKIKKQKKSKKSSEYFNQDPKPKLEPIQIENVKTQLDKISNVESKIDLLLKIESSNKMKPIEQDSEISDSEFEEVEMEQTNLKMNKDEIQVTLNEKKAKKPIDLKAKMERMFKTMQKKFSVAMLKTHLLCWIAHGFHLNRITQDPLMKGLVMSIDDSNEFHLINFNKITLKKLVKNMNEKFDVKKEEGKWYDWNESKIECLNESLAGLKPLNYLHYLLILVTLLRNLGVKTRLCVCFDVLTVKKNGVEEKNEKPKKKNLILSVDEDDPELRSTDHRNYWLEVYLEEEKHWCSLEPVGVKLDDPEFLEKRFDKQVLYVIAFDNDNRVKDVTKRYSTDWCVQTRLLRVNHLDDKKLWWEKTLSFHQPLDVHLDIEEEKQLKDMLLKRPIPASLSEFKDHPLYVLPRHLLKFQSIYPQDVTPVGHFRNEPIYSRDNLVTLCSKQTWLKYARMVKPFEKASKVVKGRIKRSEFKAGCRESPDLDVYGYWQTKKYEPPYAHNGVVPRNEFGNVELFQPCMLPHGCVHLRNMPNLNKVCRKLKIDCAAAVVGFDAHGGFSHAVYDGWIVCEEFKDTVVDAYLEEEREAAKKMIEKRQERITGNWKRLIRGLLIREKLRLKYGTDEPKAKKKNLKAMIAEARERNTEEKDELMDVDKVGGKLQIEEERVEEKIDFEEQKEKVVVVKFNRKAKTVKKKPKRKRGQDAESSAIETEEESEEEIKHKKKQPNKRSQPKRATRSSQKVDVETQEDKSSEKSEKSSVKKKDVEDDLKLSESDSE